MQLHDRWDACHPAEMRRKGWPIAAFVPFAFFIIIIAALPSFSVGAAEQRVLVYQKNGKGFVHDNLTASAVTIRELGNQDGFGVDISTNTDVFADGTLRKYAALIFANSNNEAFDNDHQRAAFRRYIRRGGGFVGIHSSTGSERSWNYFQQVQGAKFFRHSPFQKFAIKVVDRTHPATVHLGKSWNWSDECYFFTNVNPDIRVLLAADVASLRDAKRETSPGQSLNGIFPLAWCHEFDGGRQFYTSLGHKIEAYSDPIFRAHLRGGIRWVLGNTNLVANPILP